MLSKLLKSCVLSLAFCATSASASDINVNKTFVPDTAPPGTVSRVTLRITNNSGDSDATNVSFKDLLPAGMQLTATPNFVYAANCGTVNQNIATVGGRQELTFSGFSIPRKVGAVTGECNLSFNVTVPPAGNYTNIIPAGGVTATINGTTQTNDTPGEKTLNSQAGNIDVKNSLILWDGTTRVDPIQGYLNEGDSIWLETTITNTNGYSLSGINFTNEFRNTILTGGNAALDSSSSSDIETNCPAGVASFAPDVTATNDSLSLNNASLAANESCYVRVKLVASNPYNYTNATFTDTFSSGLITSDQSVSNAAADTASQRIYNGGRISKLFCPENANQASNSGCTNDLDINPSVDGSGGKVRMYINLWSHNTKLSPFRSIINDPLPPGMQLASPLDIATNGACSGVIANAGNAPGDTTLKIDARNWDAGLLPNETAGGNGPTRSYTRPCTIYTDVIVTNPNAATDYVNDMASSHSFNQGRRNINGGHLDNAQQGHTPWVYPARLRVSTGTFSVRKNIVRLTDVVNPSRVQNPNSLSYLRAGDDAAIRLTLINAGTTDVTNVDITDDLTTMGNAVVFRSDADEWSLTPRTGSTGSCSVTSGTAFDAYNYLDTNLRFQGINVPANTACFLDIPILLRSDVMITHNQTLTNTIPAANIRYIQDGNNLTINRDLTDSMRIFARAYINKSFDGNSVGVGGTSIMTIRIRNYSYNVNSPDGYRDMQNIRFTDVLPAGMRVATNDQLNDSCNGNISYNASRTEITYTGGSIINTSDPGECEVKIAIEGVTSGSWLNRVTNYGAEIGSGPHAGKPIALWRGDVDDYLYVVNSQPIINKSFEPKVVEVGETSRATVKIINQAAGAIDLSNVGLVDNLLTANASSPLRITGANGNALFSDNPDGTGSTRCNSASFSVNSANTEITLSGAFIAANSTCYMTFDVTSAATNTWINTIEANNLTNQQNLSNAEPASADVTFNGIGALGLTKSVAPVTNNGNGTYTADYTVKVKNFGDAAISNVSVSDNLVGEFGTFGTGYSISTPTVNNGTGASITLNPAFNGDGDQFLVSAAPTSTLDRSAEATITFSVTFTPQVGKTEYNNTATSGAEGTGGLVFADTSNDGDYTSGPSDTDPSNDNEPTRFTIATSNPAIGIAKTLSNLVQNPDGSYTVDATLTIANLGDENLSGVTVTDDLDGLPANGSYPGNPGFGTAGNGTTAGEYAVSSLTANGLTTVGTFDGSGQQQIATGDLAVGATATVTYQITFFPQQGRTVFDTQANAAGTGTSNTTVSDASDDTTVDANNNGNANEAGENDPSRVVIRGASNNNGEPIPTVGTWGLILMSVLMGVYGRRRKFKA